MQLTLLNIIQLTLWFHPDKWRGIVNATNFVHVTNFVQVTKEKTSLKH